MKIFRNVLLCVAVLQMCPPPCQSSGELVTSCCLKTSQTRPPCGRLKGFHSQKKGRCPVDAVVFTTVKGTTICSDPTKRWVKKCKRNIGTRKKAHMATAVKSPHLTTESAVTRSMTNKTCQG
ncbi:hypothetical protein AGOR_G00143020 [Albula goreensis]|uniref:Chemokine interleukin-8-like domain-containing protein n=1 Tax=Albula goreensis TaxID=1534307 RepID=A0A8T3D445_9TELE|nr:hypothetical protein AGOR_G00143020 [Albula goreensis]